MTHGKTRNEYFRLVLGIARVVLSFEAGDGPLALRLEASLEPVVPSP
jgi:hypothetical protein